MTNEERLEQVRKQKQAKEEGQRKRLLAANAIKKSWQRIRNERAIKELIKFVQAEISRHEIIGRTGMGFDPNGGPVNPNTNEPLGEKVKFTNEERISSMDKSLGLQEVMDYVERRLKE